MKNAYETQILNLKDELEKIHETHRDYKQYNTLIETAQKGAIKALQE